MSKSYQEIFEQSKSYVLWFLVLLTQNKISMKDIFLEYEDGPVEVFTIS